MSPTDDQPPANTPSDAAAAALRRATAGTGTKSKKTTTKKQRTNYQGRDPQLLGAAVDDFLVENGKGCKPTFP